MAETKRRRITPKGLLEQMAGRRIDPNILPASHKVVILEYLLVCPASELNDYQTSDCPNFIYESAKLLIDSRLPEYMNMLSICRSMAQEDANKEQKK